METLRFNGPIAIYDTGEEWHWEPEWLNIREIKEPER